MSQQAILKEISQININSVIEKLSNAYSKLILSGKSLWPFPSVMLWGQPGVGKSQAIYQIAKNIEEKTGKIVKVTDVRLLLFNPVDLRGIPTFNSDRTASIWLKPKIFEMDESENVVNILFLDELTSAPQSVQAAAYQITLDHKVGEHILPKNCVVIAAGNRVSDRSVSFKMPKALANRLLHFDVTTNFKNWKNWALKHNINQKIIGFLSFQPQYLNTFDSSNETVAFATPRSYELMSNILNDISDNIDEIYTLVAGIVGKGIATEFRSYLNVYQYVPKIEDIINGKASLKTKEPSHLFAISAMIIDYIKYSNCSYNEISNIMIYIKDMPKDFLMMFFTDLKTLDEKKYKEILQNSETMRIVHFVGRAVNGI